MPTSDEMIAVIRKYGILDLDPGNNAARFCHNKVHPSSYRGSIESLYNMLIDNMLTGVQEIEDRH